MRFCLDAKAGGNVVVDVEGVERHEAVDEGDGLPVLPGVVGFLGLGKQVLTGCRRCEDKYKDCDREETGERTEGERGVHDGRVRI
jgi:hypothetical protein